MADLSADLQGRALALGIQLPGMAPLRRRMTVTSSERKKNYQREYMRRRRSDPEQRGTERLRQAAQDRARRQLAKEYPDRYAEIYRELCEEVGLG